MLFCVLRLFRSTPVARPLQDHLRICSVLEQIHGTIHCEELSFWGESVTYFSWLTFSSFRGFSPQVGTTRLSPSEPPRSCSCHTGHTIHFASFPSTHGRGVITSSLCLGLFFVLIFHDGSPRLHFAQSSHHTLDHHSHQ